MGLSMRKSLSRTSLTFPTSFPSVPTTCIPTLTGGCVVTCCSSGGCVVIYCSFLVSSVLLLSNDFLFSTMKQWPLAITSYHHKKILMRYEAHMPASSERKCHYLCVLPSTTARKPERSYESAPACSFVLNTVSLCTRMREASRTAEARAAAIAMAPSASRSTRSPGAMIAPPTVTGALIAPTLVLVAPLTRIQRVQTG